MIKQDSFLYKLIQWLWLIIIVLGCIALGVYVAAPESQTKELAKIIATALLSGGVFSAFLKALQFNGIFQSTLEEVLFEPRYLNFLSTPRLLEIWRQTTDALFNAAYDDVGHKIKERIVKTYVPHKKLDNPFYYKDVEHDITIDWLDRSNNLIKVVDDMQINVVAANTSAINFNNKFRFKKNTKTDDTAHSVEWFKYRHGKWDPISECDVDKDKHHNQHETSPESEESVYDIILEGATDYKLKRTATKVIDLTKDNLLKTYFLRIVDGVILSVNGCESLHIEMSLSGLTEKFEPMAGDNGNTIKKKYKDVVFPRQGYMLSLYKV